MKFGGESELAVMHANVNHNIYWVLDQPRRIGDLDLSFLYLVVGYYKLRDEPQVQRNFSALLPPADGSEYQLAMDYDLNNINFSNIKAEMEYEIGNVEGGNKQGVNSTKNFMLASKEEPECRLLEMKKESDNVFELTIRHPFSPLQAMAIAMTRFDAQLQ